MVRQALLGFLILGFAGCSQSETLTLTDGGYLLRGGATCDGCEIRLVKVATLGHRDDPASVRPDAMARPCMVGRLADGEWIVSGIVGGGELLIYDSSGKAVRSIGRRGQGPGEYGQDLSVLVRTSDTLHVLDNSSRRIVTVTSGGRLLGSRRVVGRVQSMTLLASGAFLLHSRPSGSAGDRRHLFSHFFWQKDTSVAFGEPDQELSDLDQWTVGPAEDGGFWTASGWQYRVEKWTEPSSPDFSIEREVEWFPQNQAWSDNMYEEVPPPTWLSHLHETSDHLLWVYSIVPDSEWHPGPMMPVSPEWTEDVLDTMIEVIDLDSKEVLASLRFEGLLAPVCGQDLVYTVVSDSLVGTKAVVFRPTLAGRPGE